MCPYPLSRVVESIRGVVNKNTSEDSPGKGDACGRVVNPETEKNKFTKAQTGVTNGKWRAISKEDMEKDTPVKIVDQEFRVLKRVKGMWQFLESIGANYKFV